MQQQILLQVSASLSHQTAYTTNSVPDKTRLAAAEAFRCNGASQSQQQKQAFCYVRATMASFCLSVNAALLLPYVIHLPYYINTCELSDSSPPALLQQRIDNVFSYIHRNITAIRGLMIMTWIWVSWQREKSRQFPLDTRSHRIQWLCAFRFWCRKRCGH